MCVVCVCAIIIALVCALSFFYFSLCIIIYKILCKCIYMYYNYYHFLIICHYIVKMFCAIGAARTEAKGSKFDLDPPDRRAS